MPERYSYEEYLKELRREAEIVPDAVEEIRIAVKLHGPKAVQEQIASLTRQPVDRGTYKGAFRFENIPNGATAYNFAKHASIIERGRRPGAKAPPLAVITAWVFRKGLAKSSSKTFATNSQYRAARALAYVIARMIKRRGLPALLILTHASEEIDRRVRERLDKMLADRT